MIPGIATALAETNTAEMVTQAVESANPIEQIINILNSVVHTAAEVGIVIAEIIGISILIITAIKCFINYFRKDEHIRLELAQGIALALEFKLGGEVLHTVIARKWEDLLILGGIIALRGVLTLLLHWEIKIEEDKERLQMLDHEHEIMEARSAKANEIKEKKETET